MKDSKNPLSPHLQIYRWHISSLLSITHRISAVINLLALILILFWLIALNGVPILIIAIFSKNGLRKKNSYSFKSGIAAGIFATLSYSIVVWGMQYIEIAYVSSIREVSIIFAAIIGMIFLKEINALKRITPSILIVAGISIVYFQIL